MTHIHHMIHKAVPPASHQSARTRPKMIHPLDVAVHLHLSCVIRPSPYRPGQAVCVSDMHDFCLGFPYGALLIAGGLAGFVLAGSTTSFIAGSTSGVLMLVASQLSLSAYTRGSRSILATLLGLMTSSAVTMHMSKRYPPLMLFQKPKIILGVAFVACRFVILIFKTCLSSSGPSTHAARVSSLSLSLSMRSDHDSENETSQSTTISTSFVSRVHPCVCVCVMSDWLTTISTVQS